MNRHATNIYETELREEKTSQGSLWRYLDLSGEHLGVRVEELSPGDTSSYHHFHTLEEEHVLALEGQATLHLGSEHRELTAGDHVWFKAGEELPHHIENDSSAPFRFLVFGERLNGDVVVYPEGPVMMVKALGFKQYRFEERRPKSEGTD